MKSIHSAVCRENVGGAVPDYMLSRDEKQLCCTVMLLPVNETLKILCWDTSVHDALYKQCRKRCL